MTAAVSTLARWVHSPAAFVRECLGVTPDAWQEKMLRDMAEHNRVAAVACKGPGKTAVLSWGGLWFMATRPHAKVICTSITGDNLKDGLWAEFDLWRKKSPFLSRAFEWTQTRMFAREAPSTWFASARQWSQSAEKDQQANTLAGVHANHVLFLLDEVSDYPDGVVAAAEAALTSKGEQKLVICGNPTRTEGPLWRAAGADRHLWRVTHITGDPDDPMRSPRIDVEEARKTIAKYGRESLVVKVNILGQFPDRQADKLLDVRDCEEAQARGVPASVFAHEAKVLGLDVARFGDDAAVLQARQGRVAFQPRELRGLDTVELAEELMRALDKWDADAAFVDGTGVGAGVVDTCRARGYGGRVHEVHNGSRAMDAERFENRRAETYWAAAEWVKGGGSLPKDFLLAAELAAPSYWFDKKGRVCLEPKDAIKARLGRSPDRADALALTFAGPVRARAQAHAYAGAGQRLVHEYDPLNPERSA